MLFHVTAMQLLIGYLWVIAIAKGVDGILSCTLKKWAHGCGAMIASAILIFLLIVR